MTVDREVTTKAIEKLQEENRKVKSDITKYKNELEQARRQIGDMEKAEREKIRSLYLESKGDTIFQPDLIVDPVYGSINIDKRLARVLKHPLVQRLDSIRQLPFATIANPNASHTRLAHSMGVARLAEYAVQQILDRNDIYLENSDKTKAFNLDTNQRADLIFFAKLCGLLHDVGHAAFGHALDRLVYQKAKESHVGGQRADKYFSAQLVRNNLAGVLNDQSVGVDAEAVVGIFCPGIEPSPAPKESPLAPYFSLVKNIIDSEMDVDRMDYLARDSLMSGLTFAPSNWNTIIQGMRPVIGAGESHISMAFDDKIKDHLEQAVYGRLAMYNTCYEAEEKISCETMLLNCVDLFLDGKPPDDLLDLMRFGDDDLLSHIMRFSSPNAPAFHLARLLKLRRGFTEVFSIAMDRKVRGGKCEEIDLYKRGIQDGSIKDPFKRPDEWRESIIDKILKPEEKWNVLVYTTPKDRFDQSKEASVYLLHVNGPASLSTLSDSPWVMGMIENYALSMAKVRVFANQELDLDVHSKLSSSCKKYFRIEPGV